MSTSVASVVNHFPSAENGFTTTLASTISSGATTVPLNSVAGYANGEIAVFVVDPSDASKKQTFTGTIDTGGVQVTSVVWTTGTNQSHSGGATVVDYATATHISMMTKGISVSLDQDGTLKAGAVDNTAALADNVVTKAKVASAVREYFDKGWVDTLGTTTFPAPNTVTYNGNRSYDLVFNSTDLTDDVSNGQRLRLTRTVAAPTQCTDLEASSSQYYSKTTPAGMTFTDDFTVSAWVKLESYGLYAIMGRYGGSSGWALFVNSDGTVFLSGYNAAAGNYSRVTSYQSLPLNKWVHVAVQLDMSAFTATTTTSYVMFDGVDVPAVVSRAGTNPTALVQSGNLEIGAANTANHFDGKLAQVAIYSAKVTQANIRATISQGLSGSETSLISAYSFNNSINDLNANANNLTAQGSAVATNADSPFANAQSAGTLEYAEIVSATFSTNTTLVVRMAENSMIPTSGGVSAVSYSPHQNPYGWPGISNILAEARIQTSFTTTSTSIVAVNGLTISPVVPAGRQIKITVNSGLLSNNTAGAYCEVHLYDGAAGSGVDLNASIFRAASADQIVPMHIEHVTWASGSKTYTVGMKIVIASTGSLGGNPAYPVILKAELV